MPKGSVEPECEVILCPMCKKKMTEGSLITQSFISNVQWCNDSSEKGEKFIDIAKPSASGMIKVKGHCCRECRTVMLKY